MPEYTHANKLSEHCRSVNFDSETDDFAYNCGCGAISPIVDLHDDDHKDMTVEQLWKCGVGVAHASRR